MYIDGNAEVSSVSASGSRLGDQGIRLDRVFLAICNWILEYLQKNRTDLKLGSTYFGKPNRGGKVFSIYVVLAEWIPFGQFVSMYI